MIDFNLNNILLATASAAAGAIAVRYKGAIAKGTNFVIDSLFSLARIYFLMMKRYKKSIIRIYRETRVGYRNLRLDLDRNYISLRVSSFVHYRHKEADEELKAKKLEVLDVLKEHRHIVILGHAGTGKTTLMQWLLLKYAHGHMRNELDENLIPVFITLRSLQSGQSVDDLLPNILKQHHFKGGEKFIRNKMEKGKCLLIFDGMDEIVDDDTRKQFIKDIEDTYTTLYGKSRIIITSRIEDYPGDPFPASFREREILNLDMKQVSDFITGILEPEEKPGGLIRQIEKNEGLKKFVTNPLMLSLLTFVYRESHKKLPDDRIKVYHKCMQLMLEDRDSSKGIYEYRNKFDADDKELLLGKLAYDFSLQNKWRFSEKEALEHWKNNLPANLSGRDLKKLLKEVCKANGILKHISGKELSFLHRTFQEYYTAKEICKREQALLVNTEDRKLNDKFADKEWQEVALFLVGMMDDAGYFIQHILHLSPQLALHCLVYAKRVKDSVINQVLSRIPFILNWKIEEEVLYNLSYLVNRFGFEKVTRFISSAVTSTKNTHTKRRFWQTIDKLILTFSPQKGMVYVPSGFVENRKKQRKWIPGFWLDIYPVTNRNYYKWTESSEIKKLPRPWKIKEKGEPLVTDAMIELPVIDIDFRQAASFSSTLNKIIPSALQRRKAGENNSHKRVDQTEDKQKYLKKHNLDRLKPIYSCGGTIERVRAIAFSCANTLERARTLARARDLDLSQARDLDRALDLNLSRARAFTSKRAIVFENSLNRDLVRVLDLALARVLVLARERTYSLALAFQKALALDLKIFSKYEKMEKHYETARKAVSMIRDELKKGWTKKAWFKLFEIGKSLVDALAIFLETTQNLVPKKLLIALRQPGLLEPVDKYPPNQYGIYDLVGNVWEWTTTTNENGDHLVSGGSWTEETFDPDKEVWRPPKLRDIDLGFRCVCDWDKITQVKEIKDLKPKREKQEAS